MDLLKHSKLGLVFMSLMLATCLSAAANIPQGTLLATPAIGTVSADWKKSERLVVYFWATWCPDCREKLGGPLNDLALRTGRSVLLVATDKDDEKIKTFLIDKAVKLPTVHDENRALRKAFKAFSVPSWVVLEKSGEDYRILGQESGGDLGKIEALLTKGGT